MLVIYQAEDGKEYRARVVPLDFPTHEMEICVELMGSHPKDGRRLFCRQDETGKRRNTWRSLRKDEYPKCVDCGCITIETRARMQCFNCGRTHCLL
jgi:hypothetical protein